MFNSSRVRLGQAFTCSTADRMTAPALPLGGRMWLQLLSVSPMAPCVNAAVMSRGERRLITDCTDFLSVPPLREAHTVNWTTPKRTEVEMRLTLTLCKQHYKSNQFFINCLSYTISGIYYPFNNTAGARLYIFCFNKTETRIVRYRSLARELVIIPAVLCSTCQYSVHIRLV